ncbi:MAG: hypothetical protein JO007_06060 [Alphaproteobacteria bacterium]|nr:hypothetical protein [Alphaproteobacteria bacterium]
MAPALVTRGGVGWRLSDLFPERHGFTVMAGAGRSLSRGHILLRSSDPTAVIDLRLRVNGIQGLRVADASIMPAALNACTHAPTIMIGEKAAAMIAEDA